jgi:hypothetical protein
MKQSIVSWYVARVKYRTEQKIKQFLETKGIEHYIPFQKCKPVIPSVVFIRTDYRRALVSMEKTTGAGHSKRRKQL